MTRRQLLQKMRVYARENGLKFEAVKNRGKGGHQMIHLGDRKTTIPAPNKEVKQGRPARYSVNLVSMMIPGFDK